MPNTPADLRTTEYVARIDELLTRPFAELLEDDWGYESCGEDFKIAVLRRSGEFWSHEWGDSEDFDEYYNSESGLIDADYTALLAALTQEWGPPMTIDLEVFRPVLVAQDLIPPVVDALINTGFFGQFPAWHRQDRWIGIAQTQTDKESSICMIAVVTTDRIGSGQTR